MNENTQIDRNRSRKVQGQNGRTAQGQDELGLAVKPVYHLQEMDEAWGLTVHVPGAAKDSVEISAEQGRFVIRARRSWKKPEDWSTIYRETAGAAYELVLEHENLIAADKVHAELNDGVLRVSLPKAEAIKPRKISVS